MRVYLCTNNVASVFDARDDSLEWWLDVLDDEITNTAADFIAIHLQDLAGGDGTPDASMEPIERFSTAVRARFSDYWCSGLMCPSVHADYTGLGCLFLVRRSVLKDVAIFAWAADDSSGGWKSTAALDEPLVPEPALPARWCRHGGFSRQMFDPLDCNWKRKGWLHTRWRLAGQPFDLLNVSLPDDVDQLRALRCTTPLSSYAIHRQDALRRALDLLAAAGPAPAALGPHAPALCVVGEVNFRLDLRRLLSEAAGESALAAALATASSLEAAVRVAVQLPSGAQASTASATSDAACLDAPCRCLASLARCRRPAGEITLDARTCAMDEAAAVDLFGQSSPKASKGLRPGLRARCDVELGACRELWPALSELEVAFPPTWPHAVGAPSSAERPAYDGSRGCPSWCDRVLLDATGMRIVRAASDASYGAPEQAVVRNAHSIVRLVFTLTPSSVLALHEIPVRVKTESTAPIPLKVKFVAVGAG